MQKRAKCILNFKIQKKNKNEKKKAHLFGFVCFYILCAFFFCISNLKIHAKKDKKGRNAKKDKNAKKAEM